MGESGYSEIQKGNSVVLNVERSAFEGRSIARVDNLVIFVDGALPGDTVRAYIYKKKKQFAEARLEEILTPSCARVEPRCSHFGICGGCRWQHMDYTQQLFWKREHIIDVFEHLGRFEGLLVREPIPSPNEYFYRNKMEFSFGAQRWLLPEELGEVERASEPFALGLHIPKRFDRILSIDACYLQSPESNAILNLTREFYTAHGVKPFSSETLLGDLRHLVIREGKHTGDRLVFLITSGERSDLVPAYARLLKQPEFAVTTFVHGITRRKSSVAVADEEVVHFGPGTISERIGNCLFTISPTSFFQTNPIQAEKLYSLTSHYAELKATDRVWDLYCGTGAISLSIAPYVQSVVGVELNAGSIANARENARVNCIENVTFHSADIVQHTHEALQGQHPIPDSIILDPPRSGLHPKVVSALGDLHVERMVYVSCNPATSARDCQLLAASGYVVKEITPVDMFPHTYHIECVIQLRRE